MKEVGLGAMRGLCSGGVDRVERWRDRWLGECGATGTGFCTFKVRSTCHSILIVEYGCNSGG